MNSISKQFKDKMIKSSNKNKKNNKKSIEPSKKMRDKFIGNLK